MGVLRASATLSGPIGVPWAVGQFAWAAGLQKIKQIAYVAKVFYYTMIMSVASGLPDRIWGELLRQIDHISYIGIQN
jgi:hypothetical protein